MKLGASAKLGPCGGGPDAGRMSYPKGLSVLDVSALGPAFFPTVISAVQTPVLVQLNRAGIVLSALLDVTSVRSTDIPLFGPF
ncbi:hypothetical protein VTO42DRAFT_3140 [Malbranchea cinnamomea]